MKRLCGLFLIVSTLCSAGCVANKYYRWGSMNPPAVVQIDAGADQPSHKFDLAFLEFDDMGEFWTIGDLRHFDDHPRASQLSEVLDLIQERKKQGNLVVLTFIHGWHNNASSYDEDAGHDKSLAGFKSLLSTLAREDTSRRYLGVFMAWRGQAIPADLFLTYWDRRDAANRVSSLSLSETVFRLMFATKGAPAPLDPADQCRSTASEPSNAQFILIGHSFGARILEHAVAQPFLAMLLERESQIRDCVAKIKESPEKSSSTGSFRSPADLIVLLNAANDAFETKAMIEAMKRMNIKVVRPPRGTTPNFKEEGPKAEENARSREATAMGSYGPLILSITSQGDWATGKIMPIAQRVSSLDKNFRSSYDMPGADSKELGQLPDRSQRSYYTNNEGHIPEFGTHTVKADKSADCSNPRWPQFKGEDGCYTVSTEDSWNKTPFWVMSVTTRIIPNHSDVFKQNLIDLLNAVIAEYTRNSSETHLATGP